MKFLSRVHILMCLSSNLIPVSLELNVCIIKMLNNLTFIINLLPIITILFFINTYNIITLWYLAGLYLLMTGFYLFIEDADIFVGFLWVIDLGVGLIFFIFILHFSTFLYHKPNLDTSSRVVSIFLFLLLLLLNFLYIFSEPVTNQNSKALEVSWFFYTGWYDFYDLFFLQTVTDLNLLKEIYFSQNSIEFFIINFVLLYGILSSILLCFLIKRIFVLLTFSQYRNFKLGTSNTSTFFIRNQNFLKQQSTQSGTRGWLKKKNTKM